MFSKILLTELTVIFLYIYCRYLFSSKNLLPKMDVNTCIKTEPTTLADYEFEVNIYDINLIRLLFLVFGEALIVYLP